MMNDDPARLIASTDVPPHPSSWSRHAPGLTVLIVAAATFFTPLRHGDLQHDAPMYAWFGYRIHSTGDWFNLYWDWDGKIPYFNKPPLQLWLTALVYPFTGPTVLGARLVPALFATAAAMVFYRLVRLQYPRWIASSAAIIFCLQHELVMNILEARFDSGLLLAFMLASLAAAKLLRRPAPSADDSDSHRNAARRATWVDFLTLGAAVGFGLLTRGGNALLALPVLAMAFAWARRWDILRPGRPMLAMLLVIAAIAGPWFIHAYVAWGHRFTSAIEYDALEQNISSTGRSWNEILFYYFFRVPEGYALWLLPAILGAVTLFRRHRKTRPDVTPSALRRGVGPVDRLGVVWIVAWFVFIQCSTLRSVRYALPMFPWLSLLAAVGLFSVAPVRRVWRRFVLPRAGLASVVISAALGASDVPLYRARDLEWLRAGPSIRAAVDRRFHDDPKARRPTVYLLTGPDPEDVGPQKRCAIQFYTDARTEPVEPDRLASLPHDCWVTVFLGDKTRVKDTERMKIVPREIPHAVLLDAGVRYLIYRIP